MEIGNITEEENMERIGRISIEFWGGWGVEKKKGGRLTRPTFESQYESTLSHISTLPYHKSGGHKDSFYRAKP